MKFISVDIETSGLDPETCQILSIGAVIEDTQNIKPLDQLPHIHIGILRENISGSLFAINMNSNLIKTINHYQISSPEDRAYISHVKDMIFVEESEVVKELFKFFLLNSIEYDDKNNLYANVSVNVNPILSGNMNKMYLNVAGKNFATFDKLFLEKLPRWKQVFKIRSRILDPAILFVDWENDKEIPSLDLCKKRANFNDPVSHNAYEDAIDVISLLRKSYAN